MQAKYNYDGKVCPIMNIETFKPINKSLRSRHTRQKVNSLKKDIQTFFSELLSYLYKSTHFVFTTLEKIKSIFVSKLYKKRGKLARQFMHSGMAGLAAFGVMIAPVIAQEFPGNNTDPWSVQSPSSVLSASTQDPQTSTLVSDKVRDSIIEYDVQEGDTVSTIAVKFGVSEETVRWQNDLGAKDTIKVGQTLEILPVTGVAHSVKKGETVYSIAEKYDTSPQAIVDFPYNTFTNDETFELAVGQVVTVPEGVIQAPSSPSLPSRTRTRQTTPDAGTVVASGSFVWPTSGSISQSYSWYHKGIDVANRAAPNVLAADSGTVITSGWSSVGYGYHVVIDHGNGYRTLYAHMQALYVSAGQTVGRGAALGRMGSTGRSTGIHLHFEVIRNGVYLNPLGVLQ